MAKRRAASKVLFIGNSFTARNDLPALIARLAAGHGHAMEHRLISAGGAPLRRHWNAGDAAAAIRDGGYDRVVLQEQSTLPVKNAARMHESVRLFDAAIRDTGATTVLYMTWARLNAPASQQAITDAYTTIGRELGATVVSVGVAWQQVLHDHPAVALHDKDGSHPSPAGSYLAACVFFAKLFGEKPDGDAPDGMDVATAAILKRAAWQAVRDSK